MTTNTPNTNKNLADLNRTNAILGKIIQDVRQVFLHELFMMYTQADGEERIPTQKAIDQLEQYCTEVMGHYYSDDVILTFIENSFQWGDFASIFDYEDGCEEVAEFNEVYVDEWLTKVSEWINLYYPTK